MCVFACHVFVHLLSFIFSIGASISSISSLIGSDSVNFIDEDKSQQGIWFISY